jgi:two-component system response regulator AtoC
MQARPPQSNGVDHTRLNGDSQYVRSANVVVRGLERLLDQVSGIEVPILLIGEPGTGKRTLAYRLHRHAAKNGELFNEVTAAELNNEFLQQEDGGIPAAAFLAGRGTFYISDLGEVVPNGQNWLLQAMGRDAGMDGSDFHGRLVVSSTVGLDEAVSSGRLREDLYYGLGGVCLRVPPLRHRRDDIPALSEHFLDKYSALFGRPRPTLSPNVWRFLLEHNWPGNIRGLENTVKTMVAVGDERIAISALRRPGAAEVISAKDGLSLKQAARAASRRAERELILRVLNKTRWNRKRAAQELKISYKALLYKLKQIGLDDEAMGEESAL